jgi:hypothetical protein
MYLTSLYEKSEKKISMKITPKKINTFMLFKLPLAYFGGVRVHFLNEKKAIVGIKYRWINQNPYKSMFWAAQGMAAEMSTAILVMQEIKKTNQKVSMLVVYQKGDFFKKATGKITFTCCDGHQIRESIQRAIATGEGQVVGLQSEGENEEGIVVSNFKFQWSLKVKS